MEDWKQHSLREDGVCGNSFYTVFMIWYQFLLINFLLVVNLWSWRSPPPFKSHELYTNAIKNKLKRTRFFTPGWLCHKRTHRNKQEFMKNLTTLNTYLPSFGHWLIALQKLIPKSLTPKHLENPTFSLLWNLT